MIALHEIPDEEFDRVFNLLVPRLMRRLPGEWTEVSRIATNPARFVEVVTCLCEYRYFDNAEGYCVIDLSNDASGIRIDPHCLRFRQNQAIQWKYLK